MATSTATEQRDWFIVGRWQEFEGESRANLLRIVAVGAFYGAHLLNQYWWTAPEARDPRFHAAATALAVTWTLLSLLVLLCLRSRIFPAGLKFVSTGVDLALLTALAMLGQGPNSPLVSAYFLVLALACLRFSLRLIWCTTGGALFGYLCLLAGRHPQWFGSAENPVVVPRIEQALTLLSLLLCGVLLGQVIRRVRGLAEEFAARRVARGQEG